MRRALSIALGLLAAGCVAGGSVHPPKSVLVYKDTGKIQCQPDSGLSLTGMERALTQAGVRMLDAYCAGDGHVRPAMCGLDTGLMGVFALPPDDVGKAESLGYRRLQVEVWKTVCRY